MFKIFSVYDGKIKAFMRPFLEQHTGAAQRSFELACKQEDSPFAQFPADFVLYEIGNFNPETGVVNAYAPMIQIAAAVDHANAAKREVVKSAALVNARAAKAAQELRESGRTTL